MFRATKILLDKNKFFNEILINDNFINKVSYITNNNLQYLDQINITINNQYNFSESAINRTHVYNSELIFLKSRMRTTVNFKNNNLENLFIDMNKFIEKEIKI